MTTPKAAKRTRANMSKEKVVPETAFNEETIMATFTYKDSRIRLSRGIIRKLGTPPFVRLLIKPEKLIMCVQPCDSNKEYGTFKVPKNIFGENGKFRINSAYFIIMLWERMGWEEGLSYSVTGKYNTENNVALLNLADWSISSVEVNKTI